MLRVDGLARSCRWTAGGGWGAVAGRVVVMGVVVVVRGGFGVSSVAEVF